MEEPIIQEAPEPSARMTQALREAAELSAAFSLLMGITDIPQEQLRALFVPFVNAFALKHGITERALAFKMLYTTSMLLNSRPWAYMVLGPTESVIRKLALGLDSNQEVRDMLERGLAAASFDKP